MYAVFNQNIVSIISRTLILFVVYISFMCTRRFAAVFTNCHHFSCHIFFSLSVQLHVAPCLCICFCLSLSSENEKSVGCVLWPVKSSPKWRIMCQVGTGRVLVLQFFVSLQFTDRASGSHFWACITVLFIHMTYMFNHLGYLYHASKLAHINLFSCIVSINWNYCIASTNSMTLLF